MAHVLSVIWEMDGSLIMGGGIKILHRMLLYRLLCFTPLVWWVISIMSYDWSRAWTLRMQQLQSKLEVIMFNGSSHVQCSKCESSPSCAFFCQKYKTSLTMRFKKQMSLSVHNKSFIIIIFIVKLLLYLDTTSYIKTGYSNAKYMPTNQFWLAWPPNEKQQLFPVKFHDPNWRLLRIIL